MAVLDFVLIGAPSAGAGVLTRLLRDHTEVALPRSPRASVLVDEHRYVFGPEWFAPQFFTNEKTGAVRGMISPGHMSGVIGVRRASWPVDDVAAGMVRTLPDVKLIALLRDPVGRAIAHHRLARERGLERRPLARALREQLSPGALLAGRLRPRMPTGYVAWGEYGRILGAYRHHYPRSQLLVLYSFELETDPAGTLARVSSFLEIDDRWRVDPIPPNSNDHDEVQLPPDLHARLQAHFATDAEQLHNCCATRAPWSDNPELAGDASQPQAPADDSAAIVSERLVGVERVAEEIGGALERGRGFALIRLGVAETTVLNEGMWPIDGVRVDLARVGVRGDPGAAAALVRDAIVDADVVGVVESRDRFAGAPLLERLLLHFDLYPRLRCSAEISYELLGVDPATGLFGARSRPLPPLRGRPLALVGLSALVGSAMWRQRERLQGLGLDVRLAVGLDDMSEVQDAFMELAAQRDSYDAVLVAGDVPAKPLCTRLARELDVVALDIGHALDRTLHSRHVVVAEQLNARRDVSEYLRQSALPAREPPHELEGQLVRLAGEPAVYYIERGAARALKHRELLELFDRQPVEIERQVLDSLPPGMPLFAVHERFGGTYLPINGTRRPIQLGLLFTVVDDHALDILTFDDRPIHWYPSAGPGLAGRRAGGR